MTNKNIFLYALSCIGFILLMQSCNDNELKSPASNLTLGVEWRDPCECEDEEDCCCAIRVLSSFPCTLQVCGALAGTAGPCPAPSGCIGSIVALTSSQFVFTTLNPSVNFCALMSQGMWIRNITLGTTVVFNITCLAEDFNPPWITNIVLGYGERINLQTESGCELNPC